MSAILSLLLPIISTAPPPSHDQANYLYRELRDKGVAVSSTQAVPLPAPLLPDGLDAKAQQKVLKALAGADYPLDELLRPSVVAPHVYRFRDIKPSDPEAPAYGVDLWFIAYGSLDRLAQKNLNDYFTAARQDATVRVLNPEELAKRGIRVGSSADVQERFSYVVYPLFDKVQVSGTTLGVSTRTTDSILIAQKLDARFANDADFPNRWQALKKDDDGKSALVGTPQAFDGVGSYIKITKLQEPAGALFVEYHSLAIEPKKWFNAANLLRSKLPLAIQGEVRAFRRELAKAK